MLTALPRRLLGRTGLEVTIPSLGGVGLGGKGPQDLYGGVSDAEAVGAVHRALERGINFIDSSPLYAESERRIGVALGELAPAERAKVLLSSKVGDECPPYSNNGGHSAFSFDGVKSSVEVQCIEIGTESLSCCCGNPTRARAPRSRTCARGCACHRGSPQPLRSPVCAPRAD